MPSYSLAGGVDASYVVSADKTTVVITSKDRLKHRGVQVGTGRMIFHWVQEGKTQAWRCEISMLDPVAAQVVETAGTDGGQRLEVELGNVYPAGCILQGNMVGTLMAPAVHVDVPFGSDVWAFLVRSPWFPLKFRIDKPVLAVEHDEGRATASLDVSEAGMVTAQVTVDGTGFKSASLVVGRTMGSYTSNEVICEVGPGTQAFEWKPIVRLFDLLPVTRGSISERQLADVARGLGAQISSGILGAGSVQGDFVLCDGPATSYTWLLKGHSGFLENVEDQTAAKFTW